jgi:phosphoesterase RecJ-like protein
MGVSFITFEYRFTFRNVGILMNYFANNDHYLADVQKTVELLKGADHILIIAHEFPDGDTIGSSFALGYALTKLGKKSRILCSDNIPTKYEYIYSDFEKLDFEPEFIVAADIADVNLIGEKLRSYTERINLCIDHHISNNEYADFTLLDVKAAATCEIISDVIGMLGVKCDSVIANCIYTGLATDTGCFRYSNTSSKTLRCAADMVDYGAKSASINKRMFETNSRSRLEIERSAMNSLEFFSNDKIALICITLDMMQSAGAREQDLEGIPSLPVRIEGVIAGITIKEKSPEFYKVSIRTNEGLNASKICSALGGGGHAAAAGCQYTGKLEDIKKIMIKLVSEAILNRV